jgi:hypothetical protein
MKVNELLEAADEDSSPPTYVKTSTDETLMLLKKHCSDLLWMIKMDAPFRRGDKKLRIPGGLAIVDPTQTVRMSENTSNFYTMLMSNLPSWKDWPRRNRSFICSTEESKAAGHAIDYGKPSATFNSQSENQTYVIIPCNGSKIGEVGEADIWGTRVNFLGKTWDLPEVNHLFDRLNLLPTWKEFKEFDSKPLDEKMAELSVLEKPFSIPESYIFRWANDFIGTLNKSYDPDLLGFAKHTTSSFPRSYSYGEYWIDGPCVFISSRRWKEIREKVIK